MCNHCRNLYKQLFFYFVLEKIKNPNILKHNHAWPSRFYHIMCFLSVFTLPILKFLFSKLSTYLMETWQKISNSSFLSLPPWLLLKCYKYVYHIFEKKYFANSIFRCFLSLLTLTLFWVVAQSNHRSRCTLTNLIYTHIHTLYDINDISDFFLLS